VCDGLSMLMVEGGRCVECRARLCVKELMGLVSCREGN